MRISIMVVSKNSRTHDNMFILLHMNKKQLLLNILLNVAYVDFRKAFNFVNKTFLLYKLLQQGYFGRLFNLIKNTYGKNNARIKVKHLLYKFMYDKCGGNQGVQKTIG